MFVLQSKMKVVDKIFFLNKQWDFQIVRWEMQKIYYRYDEIELFYSIKYRYINCLCILNKTITIPQNKKTW